jgi:hypothetical protein
VTTRGAPILTHTSEVAVQAERPIGAYVARPLEAGTRAVIVAGELFGRRRPAYAAEAARDAWARIDAFYGDARTSASDE